VATPQYGAPPPPPPPAASGTDRTTLFGVLGIVLSVCCGIIGLIFAILSLTQSRKYGSSPVLGYVGIAIAALNVIGGIVYNVAN
jgi:hypothetical protein